METYAFIAVESPRWRCELALVVLALLALDQLDLTENDTAKTDLTLVTLTCSE
jgi:hypothetical protein